MEHSIQMVDLKGQYEKIKIEIGAAILEAVENTTYINGPQVKNFEDNLSDYLNVKHVIGCANGTDSLQIALMALGLKQGDEVIVPCFTYVATAEVIALLKLKPIMVEVDPNTFNSTADVIEKAITCKTKAIIPVHLFGQCADMEPILKLAQKYKLYVVEDAAQAIGAGYTFTNGEIKMAGTMGHIGCTSFFPSKNLGCYGDGGALYTNDDELATKIRMIANHGQSQKYHHEVVGVNSRLDTLQAAILSVKLNYLNQYIACRTAVAEKYDQALKNINWLQIPKRQSNSTHVFHQYTIILKEKTDRDKLKKYLLSKEIPSMIYYPIALHLQKAFKTDEIKEGDFPISEHLCNTVLSLPIHTEMNDSTLNYIIEAINGFKNG